MDTIHRKSINLLVFKKNTNENTYTHIKLQNDDRKRKKKKKRKNLARTKNNFLLLLFWENTAKQLLWHGFLFHHMLLLLLLSYEWKKEWTCTIQFLFAHTAHTEKYEVAIMYVSLILTLTWILVFTNFHCAQSLSQF